MQYIHGDQALQRGRALLSAEGASGAKDVLGWWLLQRGRAQLSAEGAERLAVDLREDKASTGPRSIERGAGDQVLGMHITTLLQQGRESAGWSFLATKPLA